MTGPDGRASSPDGGWAAYLDALEAVADGLDAALTAADTAGPGGGDPADGAGGWLPLVPDIAVPLPAGPPPAASADRREALLARLVLLTDRLGRRRDAVAELLAGLPSRRPRTAERYAGALGASLDLTG